MLRVDWKDEALEEAEGILAYIAERNPRAADDLAERIAESIDRLVVWSSIGRPGRVLGTRELVISSSYLIVYRVTNQIEILRVLHGRQEYP